jgi:hypothetical protein
MILTGPPEEQVINRVLIISFLGVLQVLHSLNLICLYQTSLMTIWRRIVEGIEKTCSYPFSPRVITIVKGNHHNQYLQIAECCSTYTFSALQFPRVFACFWYKCFIYKTRSILCSHVGCCHLIQLWL